MEQIALDSILAMTIIEELQHQYEVDLPTFLFYENETIHDSANAILELMENARS
jgi:acyl carrier protein